MATLRQRKNTKSADKDNQSATASNKEPTKTKTRPTTAPHRRTKLPVGFLSILLLIVAVVCGVAYSTYGKFLFVEKEWFDLTLTAAEWDDVLATKQILLIGGPHKAGTTVLADLLSHCEAISGLGSTFETGADFSEGLFLQDVYPTFGIGVPRLAQSQHYRGLGRYALHPQAHLTAADERITVEHKVRVLNRLGQFWNTSRAVLMEKSPPTAIMSAFLQALYQTMPDTTKKDDQEEAEFDATSSTQSPVTVKFLYITRHPIANMYAHQKVDWWLSNQTELMQHYLKIHEYMAQDWPQLQYEPLLVTLEDLSEQPRATLRRILTWLNVPGLEASDDHDDLEAAIDTMLQAVPVRRNLNDKYRQQWCEQQHPISAKAISGSQLQEWQASLNVLQKTLPALNYDVLHWCDDTARAEPDEFTDY